MAAKKMSRLEDLAPALAAGLIERTAPDKPTSRLQRYRLTQKGRAWLAAREARVPESERS
jgi:DNA-binding PadR family transcriptional regulator